MQFALTKSAGARPYSTIEVSDWEFALLHSGFNRQVPTVLEADLIVKPEVGKGTLNAV